MKLSQADLQSRLAAEYVLGTMRGAARRRFEDYLRMPHQRSLREQVAKWEAHLTPLANRLPAVTPPDRVWLRIQAAISGNTRSENKTPLLTGISSQNAVKTPANKGLWQSFAFWRGL